MRKRAYFMTENSAKAFGRHFCQRYIIMKQKEKQAFRADFAENAAKRFRLISYAAGRKELLSGHGAFKCNISSDIFVIIWLYLMKTVFFVNM